MLRKKIAIILAILMMLLLTTSSSSLAENNLYSSSIGFYNGTSVNDAKQCIGISTTVDKIKWGKSAQPFVTPRAGLFDSVALNSPYPVQVGDLLYLYYAGYNGSKWNGIGLVVLTKDLQILERPRQAVLGFGQLGEWDDSKIFRPVVIYDANAADPNKKFAMFYNGANTSGVNQTGLAYSSDGVSWVKYAKNPVLTNGVTGDWDSKWAFADSVINVNGTYYMAYNGYDGTRIQTGIATSTSLEGPWIKDINNPVLKARPNAAQILTTEAVAGSSTIQVSDSSVFEVDEPCYLSSSSGVENVRIKSKPSATSIELYEPTIYNHTGATIKSILSKSVGPNQLSYDGMTWKLYGSAWGVIPGYETTTYAEGQTIDTLQLAYNKMPTLNYDTVVTDDWDSKSQENLKFINLIP